MFKSRSVAIGTGRSSRWTRNKHQRRLNGVDEMLLSLSADGLTTGEISVHFAQIYGAQVSKETISRITDKISEDMATWASRLLDGV